MATLSVYGSGVGTDMSRWIIGRWAYSPDQPRAPKGSPIGGQWVGSSTGALIPLAESGVKEAILSSKLSSLQQQKVREWLATNAKKDYVVKLGEKVSPLLVTADDPYDVFHRERRDTQRVSKGELVAQLSAETLGLSAAAKEANPGLRGAVIVLRADGDNTVRYDARSGHFILYATTREDAVEALKPYSTPRELLATVSWQNKMLMDTGVMPSPLNPSKYLRELSVEGISEKKNYDQIPKGTYKLGDLLNHPELYALYPSLRSLTVHVRDSKSRNDPGGYLQHSRLGEGPFELDHMAVYRNDTTGDKAARMHVLLHETQHAVDVLDGRTPMEYVADLAARRDFDRVHGAKQPFWWSGLYPVRGRPQNQYLGYPHARWRANYDPAQPRAPRGTSEGGQWIGGAAHAGGSWVNKSVRGHLFTSLEKPPTKDEIAAHVADASKLGMTAVFDFDLHHAGGVEAAAEIHRLGGVVSAYHVGGGGGRAWGGVGAGEEVRKYRDAAELGALTNEVKELVGLGADVVHFDNTHRMSGKTLEGVVDAIVAGGAGWVAKNNPDKFDLVMKRRGDLVPAFAVVENAMYDLDETTAASALHARGVSVYVVGFEKALRGKGKENMPSAEDVTPSYAAEYARVNPWANVILFADEEAFEGRDAKWWRRTNYRVDQPRGEDGRWILDAGGGNPSKVVGRARWLPFVETDDGAVHLGLPGFLQERLDAVRKIPEIMSRGYDASWTDEQKKAAIEDIVAVTMAVVGLGVAPKGALAANASGGPLRDRATIVAKVKELREAGATYEAIVAELGISKSTAQRIVGEVGLTRDGPGRPRHLAPEQEAKLAAERVAKKLRQEVVAATYGVSQGTVSNVLRRQDATPMRVWRKRQNYAPDQPRAPRGTAEGGQWIDKEATFTGPLC